MDKNNMLGLIKADLRRGFLSWGFFAALFLMFLSLFFPWITEGINNMELLAAFNASFVKVFFYTAPIIAILSFNGIYYDETKSGFIRFVILRTSRRKYVFSKLFSSAVSSFVATALGIILFSATCALFRKDFTILEDNYWSSVLISALTVGLFSAAWSFFGLATSAMVNSKFFSFVLPFMLFHIIGYVSREFWFISDDAGAFFYRLTPMYLALPSFGTPQLLLRALLMDIVYASIFIFLFSHFVKKRGIYDA